MIWGALHASYIRKLLVRAIVTWAIEVLAFGLLVQVVPGMHVADPGVALLAVLAIGALNALVRPVIILLAVNLGVVPFAVVALLANAVMVLLSTRVVPGFTVDGLGTAFVVAFGLAVLNALLSNLLGINDDDSFYRNVIRWAERRQASAIDETEPGTILVQIDGLAERVLRAELDSGGLPTLARWLRSGTHRLLGWECDVPSMTSSGQAGILYGNNANIPAFRWYDKVTGHLFVSNHPRDAHVMDQRQATEHPLLRDHGSSVGNIFAGGAEHCVMTMSRLTSDSGQFTARSQDLYDYFINPYNFYRALGAMVWEVVVELWEAWRQGVTRAEPRMHRGGTFPLVRAIVTVLLRDVTTWMLVADMFAGRRHAYADYLGYDEVAHHAGPFTEDARRVLRKLDGQLRQLESAARRAPRPYRFVVLSDHGQSTGATFRQRYGLSLTELIHRSMQPHHPAQTVTSSAGTGEGAGQVHALVTDATHATGAVGHGARMVARHLLRRAPIAHESVPSVEQSDVVVCASGNLALVYFAREQRRLSLEAMQRSYPGVIEGLLEHEGIGFLLVFSEASNGAVVLSRDGRFDLDADRVEGQNPLAGLGPNTARFLRRLSTYANVGDIVVNSLWEPNTARVAAFEELIGCHGGAGGAQTSPFVVYPAEWGEPPAAIVGAEQLHAFLRVHVSGSVAADDQLRQHGQVI